MVKKEHVLLLLLAIWLAAIYGQMFGHAFINDDLPVIANNQDLADGRQIPNWFARSWPLGNVYRPLVMIELALEYQLWGNHPAGYRFTSYLWHLLLVCLLWRLWRALSVPVLLASLALAVYALHPLHNEVVTSASTRGDTMGACCCLLALLCHLHGGRRRLASPFFVLAGCLCKETSAAVVAVLILWQWGLGEASRKREWGWLLPHLLVLAIFLLARTAALGMVGAGNQDAFAGIDARSRVYTMCLAFVCYLRLCVWPSHLGFDYQLNDFPVLTTLLEWRTVFSLLMIALYLALFWWSWRRARQAAFWLGWFVVFLLPVSNVVVPTTMVMAERFLTLPMAACALALAWPIWALAANAAHNAGRRTVALVLLGLLLAGYSVAGYRQTAYRVDERSYWQRTLEVSPNSYIARMKLAALHLRARQVEEAFRLYQEATPLRCYPLNAPMAPYNCAIIRLQQGRTSEALIYLEMAAARVEHWRLPVREYVLHIYRHMGDICRQSRQTDKAVAAYRKLLQLASADAAFRAYASYARQQLDALPAHD